MTNYLQRSVRELLHLQARTATTSSPVMEERNSNGARFYLDVTAASGTGGLTLQLRSYTPNGIVRNIMVDGSAITAAGYYSFEIMPSARAASGTVRATSATSLPIRYDVNVVHGDGSSYTYGVAVETI